MSGTPHGKVECFFYPQVNPSFNYRDIAQGVFTSLYNFFLSHPNMTLIARNGGNGGTAANVNYWDQTNPFLNNAWFVFRMNTQTENVDYLGPRTYPWYVLVQFQRADQGLFGASPGNPGLCDGLSSFATTEIRVGVQFAIGVGGDQNPWNGTGTLGANLKGDPVWKVPSGGSAVLVWPRSNSVGGATGTNGAHVTSRQNCMIAYYKDSSTQTLPSRVHFMADDDSFATFASGSDDNNYALCYFGLFTPRPNLTLQYPMVALSTLMAGLPINRTLVYGSINGQGFGASSPNNGGGIVTANPADGLRGVFVERYVQFFDSFSPFTLMNPSKYFSTPTFDEYPISLAMFEAPQSYGWAGQIDFIREIATVESLARNNNSSRAVFGGTTGIGNNVKVTAPWAAGVQPRSGLYREGINF